MVDIQGELQCKKLKNFWNHWGSNLLSVVVPVHNEQEVLLRFHRRLAAVLDQLQVESEVVYVNDGSIDGTLAVIRAITRTGSPRSIGRFEPQLWQGNRFDGRSRPRTRCRSGSD